MYNVCTASQGVHGDPIQDGGGSDRSRKRQEKLSRRILLRRRQPRQRPQKSCHQIPQKDDRPRELHQTSGNHRTCQHSPDVSHNGERAKFKIRNFSERSQFALSGSRSQPGMAWTK